VLGAASGKAKKEAEQEAARLAIVRLDELENWKSGEGEK
jgi:hypothetical protein